jgi:hypothetical protein
METSLIEQLDKARYNLIKWLTFGWVVGFGAYIIKDWITEEFIMLQFLIELVGFIGFGFFAVNLQKYIRLSSKVKYSRLNDALNNELHEVYKYKSAYVGFKVFLVTISLSFVISLYYQLSAKNVCEITLYLGVLSSLIAGLIYNKD